MKKIMIALVMIIALCGCSSTAEPNGSAPSAKPVDNLNISTEDKAPSSSEPLSAAQSLAPPSSAQSSLPTANEWSGLSTKKLGWGQGYNVNSDNQPTGCIDYQSKYGHLGGVFITDAKDNITLTFDEGYENGYTAQILDTLKEKEVKAVFFVTYDYAKRNPDLIRRMINEGHTVGNHSYNHPSMPTLTDEKVKSEIQRLHDYVVDNFNYEMTLFRPPMGEFSEKTLAITKSLGYKSVFWSFAYVDYDTKKQPEKQAAFNRITKAAHSGGIYLLHAVSKTNAEIIGNVIDSLRGQGYTLDIKGL